MRGEEGAQAGPGQAQRICGLGAGLLGELVSFTGLGSLDPKEDCVLRESSPSHLSLPRQSFLMLQCAGQGRRRKNLLKM